MADDDQDISFSELVDEEYDGSIKNSPKETKCGVLKTKIRRSFRSDSRTARQRFLIKWGVEFPWLRPSNTDELVGFCITCRRNLVCKKSHLERHQKTFKHMRLQGFENVYTVNEPEADLIEAHTSGYLDDDEYENESHDQTPLGEDSVDFTAIKVEATKFDNSPFTARPKAKSPLKKKAKVERSPLTFTTIERMDDDSTPRSAKRERESERARDISDYYYLPPRQSKDSFDLFFESISATVKALPPKLAAEVKSRVSQLIAEFELRAICEKEAQDKATASQQSGLTTAVGITVDQSMCSNSNSEIPTRITHQQEGQAIAHYVYLQSK